MMTVLFLWFIRLFCYYLVYPLSHFLSLSSFDITLLSYSNAALSYRLKTSDYCKNLYKVY